MTHYYKTKNQFNFHKHNRRKLDQHNGPTAGPGPVADKVTITTTNKHATSATANYIISKAAVCGVHISHDAFRRRRRPRLLTHTRAMIILSLILNVATLINVMQWPQIFAQGLAPPPPPPPLPQGQNSYLLPGHNMENLHVSELEPVGKVIHQLIAQDARSSGSGSGDPNRPKITYALTGETFRVDEDTGEVSLRVPLDRETQPTISLVVNVLSSSLEQPLESRRRVIVIDDADDSWPLFQPHKLSVAHNSSERRFVYQAEIGEQAPLGSLLMGELMVKDADEGPNAEVVFECRPERSSNKACEHFSIEPRRLKSGHYMVTLRTRKALDYERHQQYRFALVARGKRPSPLTGQPLESEASILVNVLNIQDEGPVFVNAPYSVSMPEGVRGGERLLKLIVQDGDLAPQRELTVMVTDELYANYFHVVKDPQVMGGKIFWLETKDTIDRENSSLNLAMGNLFTINLLAAELNDRGDHPVASEPELYAGLRQHEVLDYNRVLMKRETVTVMIRDLADTVPLFVRTSSPHKRIENNFLVINISESLHTGALVPNLDLTALDLDQGDNARFNLKLVDGVEPPAGPLASDAFALESEIVHGKAEIVLRVLNSALLDYEDPSKRVYSFHLVASKPGAAVDGGSGDTQQQQQLLVQKLDLQFQVQDANDNWPEFERDQYIVEVPEGTPPNHLVATIRALDRDSGPYGRVQHILYGFGANKFRVYPEEGKIVVGDCGRPACLDYEDTQSYSLTYEARDGGGRTRNVSVLINILDVNDHAPKFTEQVYKRELISDNLSSRQNYISPQLIVRARDEDGPTQGRNNITYRIESTNLTGLEIESNSGLVHISQPLDLDQFITNNWPASGGGGGGASSLSASGSGSNYHNHHHYHQHQQKLVFQAEVVATDNGTPPLSSSATILLVVKGNRDGAPQFKQDLYQAYVHENQPPMKPFFQVQAVDPDDKDSQLRYSLGFDPNDLLTIDAHLGQLSFKGRVDFDDFKGTPYNITVYATDIGRPYPLRAAASVSILLQDVNNKGPEFSEREYRSLLVQGRTKPGDVVVPQVRAVDPDLNANLNYSILTNQITINDRNGQQFTLDQIENSTSGYLAHMTRPDRHKMVNELKRLLGCNPRTGAIELKAEPDYTLVASISLRLRVVDLNQEIYTPTGELQEDFANCTLFLQTHVDRRPVFAPPWALEQHDYNISILEELPPGTPIFSLLAKDPLTNQRVDNYEKVHESDPRDYFRVARGTGQVFVNRRIDYEELPVSKRMSLTVRAYGGLGETIGEAGGGGGEGKSVGGDTTTTTITHYSLATINIQIIDLNDNAPQFRNSSYHAAVSESITSSHEIVQVSAHDRDSHEFSQIHYSLSGPASSPFQIHPTKGTLSLRKNARLDRDTEPSYTLTASASDCNEEGTHTLPAAAAAAARGGDIGPLGGGDSVRASSAQAASASASASAGGCKRSSVLIEITVLDENDNEPVFINTNRRGGEYEAVISETVSPGSVITQVLGRDMDEGPNGQLGYEIVRTEEILTRLLSIDSEGYIRASGSLSGLGRATPYRLTIRAYDLGTKQSRQSYAPLLLTIKDVVHNDGVPKFLRPKPDEMIVLPESAGPNSFVYKVQAVDPDEEANGKLMYKFIQPSDTFEIDPFEGVIKTQRRANFYLDRELVPNYTLIIVAQDLGSPPKQAQQVLTILIGDTNDNEPYFERGLEDPPIALYVEEEVPVGSLIGTIRALDKDVGQNALIGYDIIEGNSNNLFRLDWTPEQLERGSKLAAAGGGQQEQDAHNNHGPPQLGPGNNPCRIYSTGRLDRETRDSYTLTIRATSMSKMHNQLLHSLQRDGGPLLVTGHHGRGHASYGPPYNSQQYNASDLTKVRVTIHLLDINDNRPVFAQPNPARSVVDSSAEAYSQLMVMRALDADSSSAEMRYSILEALYYSDSKFRGGVASETSDHYGGGGGGRNSILLDVSSTGSGAGATGASMKYAFNVHPTTGVLRNSVPLRPFIDGYFEVFIKADSSGGSSSSSSASSMMSQEMKQQHQDEPTKCSHNTTTLSLLPPGIETSESCHVAITKVVVFVTHQRETFRFVFNKTRLNDRLDEFKEKIQHALEDIVMFEPGQVQASIADQSIVSRPIISPQDVGAPIMRAEKFYLNTFNTDFYERDDGSLDFSTITSCSQLVKFDDRSQGYAAAPSTQLGGGGRQYPPDDNILASVPNQVVSYDDVLSLLKTLNTTQTSRQQQQQQQQQQTSNKPSLFSQYGLVKIERCLSDKTMYKMALSERLALYIAAMIALISIMLAFIVSKMRKNYERNLKILQRSKYQYMGAPYA